jgi:thiosulfate/3-mercaptopyruvate sulfurtransferase
VGPGSPRHSSPSPPVSSAGGGAGGAFGPGSDGLVSTDWLDRHLGSPDLRVVDVRWYLDPTRRGREAYAAGHIPGAVFLDVDADLSAPGGARGGPSGRHPWPGVEQVTRVLGGAGIGTGTRVVAYDDQAGAVAARLWFILVAHGHDEAAVLDGGLARWESEGRRLDTRVPEAAPRAFVPRFRSRLVLSKAEMAARDQGLLVLDARAPERYRGEVEPIDPRPGHIPGARSMPFGENLTAGASPVFLPAEVLRARYAAVGADRREPVVYCGSGVTACHDLLALHRAGLCGRLYAGSWSEWSADPSLPVATGEEAGGPTR